MTESFSEYIERVYTFDLKKWCLKPKKVLFVNNNLKINPYKCARFGFICKNIDELTCICCESTVKFEEDIDLFLESQEKCRNN